MPLAWDSDLLVTNLEADVVGASIESPRSLNGLTGAIDMTGGGYWTARGMLDLFTSDAHRAFWKLKAYLDGGVGTVDFPLQTEKFGLVPDPSLTITTKEFYSSCSEGDTQVFIRIAGDNDGDVLRSGMIFGIHHGASRHKAYIIRDVTSGNITTGQTDYHLNIRPPLRFDTPDGTDINFAPLVQMRLPAGQQMVWPVAGNEYLRARAPFMLIEAIPTES